MAEQETSYDAIVRVEIAIEILNQARVIVIARIYEHEGTNAGAAEALRRRRRDLIELQQSIRVADLDGTENHIAVWGPRVQDEARFWAEF
ncbi:hypothetical protein AB4Z52_21020 [Rhizobium sp. 2YAF20]|uniref:hypothetical protein n=1 Tax=Rhizobium sp. 2YAF20 TaxID=3233027 RepID=UPI003F95653C